MSQNTNHENENKKIIVENRQKGYSKINNNMNEAGSADGSDAPKPKRTLGNIDDKLKKIESDVEEPEEVEEQKPKKKVTVRGSDILVKYNLGVEDEELVVKEYEANKERIKGDVFKSLLEEADAESTDMYSEKWENNDMAIQSGIVAFRELGSGKTIEDIFSQLNKEYLEEKMNKADSSDEKDEIYTEFIREKYKLFDSKTGEIAKLVSNATRSQAIFLCEKLFGFDFMEMKFKHEKGIPTDVFNKRKYIIANRSNLVVFLTSLYRNSTMPKKYMVMKNILAFTSENISDLDKEEIKRGTVFGDAQAMKNVTKQEEKTEKTDTNKDFIDNSALIKEFSDAIDHNKSMNVTNDVNDFFGLRGDFIYNKNTKKEEEKDRNFVVKDGNPVIIKKTDDIKWKPSVFDYYLTKLVKTDEKDNIAEMILYYLNMRAYPEYDKMVKDIANDGDIYLRMFKEHFKNRSLGLVDVSEEFNIDIVKTAQLFAEKMLTMPEFKYKYWLEYLCYMQVRYGVH